MEFEVPFTTTVVLAEGLTNPDLESRTLQMAMAESAWLADEFGRGIRERLPPELRVPSTKVEVRLRVEKGSITLIGVVSVITLVVLVRDTVEIAKDIARLVGDVSQEVSRRYILQTGASVLSSRTNLVVIRHVNAVHEEQLPHSPPPSTVAVNSGSIDRLATLTVINALVLTLVLLLQALPLLSSLGEQIRVAMP